MEQLNKTLPEDLLHYIYKIYYTKEIIPLIKNKKSILCLLCCVHGFPCVNCAGYCYEFKYGNGYLYGFKINNLDNNLKTYFKPRKPQEITYSETFDSLFKDAMSYYRS